MGTGNHDQTLKYRTWALQNYKVDSAPIPQRKLFFQFNLIRKKYDILQNRMKYLNNTLNVH